MLDWTGERFVPWAKEAAVAYEHLHRYMWASTLVRGKRVLDLASGEGYGANLLARHASYVCGVDIDEAAVQHATEKYREPNLQFLKGSVTAVPISEARSFDVIVCFEAIEHIEEHDALLGEVKRLLKDDGLFVVSTPNKDVYDPGGETSNPFHVKELTFYEFNTLLTRHFSSVGYLGQRLHPASSLWPLGVSCGNIVREFVVGRGEKEFSEISSEERVPRYFVGIASDAPGTLQPGSVLLDHSDELTDLVNEKDRDLRETKASAESAKLWLERQLDERSEALAWRGTQVEQLSRDLDWVRACNQDMERTIAARDQALAWRATQVNELEQTLEAQKPELQELAEIRVSRGWRMVLKLRGVRDRISGIFGK